MTNSEKNTEDWDRRLWETYSSRFIAARRLERRHWLSSITISILSGYTLLLTVLSVTAKHAYHQINLIHISWATIGLSLGVLIISLFELSQSYLVRSEAVKRSAEDISALLTEFKCDSSGATDDEKGEINKRVGKRYHELIKQCYVNHDPIDYLKLKADRPGVFFQHGKFFRNVWVRVLRFLINVWFYSRTNLIYFAIFIGVMYLTYWLFLSPVTGVFVSGIEKLDSNL